jgi:hypothetical protein
MGLATMGRSARVPGPAWLCAAALLSLPGCRSAVRPTVIHALTAPSRSADPTRKLGEEQTAVKPRKVEPTETPRMRQVIETAERSAAVLSVFAVYLLTGGSQGLPPALEVAWQGDFPAPPGPDATGAPPLVPLSAPVLPGQVAPPEPPPSPLRMRGPRGAAPAH